jgi:hypothetical protein
MFSDLTNHARDSDPSTSHEAAGKARPRVQFYVNTCDDQGRRGCTNDEATAAAEQLRDTPHGAVLVGNQKTPFRPDQFSPIASKLIRQGMALYLDPIEERLSRVGSKQMPLCMIRFLTDEEITALKKLPRNKKFGIDVEPEFEYPEWMMPKGGE